MNNNNYNYIVKINNNNTFLFVNLEDALDFIKNCLHSEIQFYSYVIYQEEDGE